MFSCVRRAGSVLLALVALVGAVRVEAAALTPDTAAKVDRLVRDRLAGTGAPPGFAISILAEDGQVVSNAYGVADLEQGAPVGPNSVFPIASITKTFTALAILQLEQEGRLSTTDPLSRFLPDFPGSSGITLRDLLVHTSGIAEFTELSPFAQDQARDWTPDELIALIAKAPPLHPPGEVCLYSDSGYILLGHIVEIASGQSFGDYVRAKIAQPLAMSSVAIGSHRDLIPHRVQGYVRTGTAWFNAPYISLQAPWAAGGLLAKADDLVRLGPAIGADGPLLQAKSYAEMIAPVMLSNGSPCRLNLPSAEATFGYGLEIVRFDDLPNHRAIGKSGVFPGYSSYFATFEGSGLTVAAFANADGSLPFTVETVHDIAKLILSEPAP